MSFLAIETTLRPGLLVSLKTTVTGNVSYRRQTIEAERVTADGALHGRWETEKTVADAAEHERSKKARADARNAIAAVCKLSAFGLLCPQDDKAKLDEAISKAQTIVDQFNAGAMRSRIAVYVLTGTISEHDQQAVAAINSEILSLLMEADTGLERADVKLTRDACNALVKICDMLTEKPRAILYAAIDGARDAARQIVRAGNAGDLGNEARTALGEAMAFFAR